MKYGIDAGRLDDCILICKVARHNGIYMSAFDAHDLWAEASEEEFAEWLDSKSYTPEQIWEMIEKINK